MWYKLEYSSETIDNLKKEMQRLQDEARRLLCEAKMLDQEQEVPRLNDVGCAFQAAHRDQESAGHRLSRVHRYPYP